MALQLANGASNPPAEIVIISLMAEPDSVPVSVPRPVVELSVTVIVTVPERFVLDCVTCIVIEPGPDESFAVPRHDPATSSGGGEDGAEGDDEPRHPAADTTATSPSVHSPWFRRVIGPLTIHQ